MISMMILIVYAQDFLDIQDHISYDFSYQREVLITIKQSPGKGGAGASFLWSLLQRERGVQG